MLLLLIATVCVIWFEGRTIMHLPQNAAPSAKQLRCIYTTVLTAGFILLVVGITQTKDTVIGILVEWIEKVRRF